MADNILETQNLSKEFGGFVAVNGVDLQVRRHSIHALIGPNGAGKTTMFNLVTKFLLPTRGKIFFNGREITYTKPATIARQGMVRSFQISAVFPNLTLIENVRIALQNRHGSDAYRFWRSERSLDELNDRAEELIDAVGLTEFISKTAGELSYGRKRALEIATTLALEPELMLLDEPMAGMGHEDIDRTADLIHKVSPNRTILMVEHNLSVVARLANTITVLQRGEVLAEGPYSEVSANPDVRRAYMGSATAH
ncbi:ABC transporter ATP-binding protein [Segnochrobactraceae bacterium EtOH-i3]